MTVLVTDLVNSTELVASLDPEAAMNRLTPILTLMSDAVTRLGGTIVSTLGDGIMAMFGAPVAQEGHAVLACRAALAIRADLRAAHGDLRVRTGLHCGEIVAHTDTAGREETSTAFGLALHIASRLPTQIDADEICLTESCFRLVREHADVSALGLRTLRGVPQPILLYGLRGMSSARNSVSRSFELTPFVGRVDELAALKSSLDQAGSGVGAVAYVTGAPGAGKSRLCHEFAEHCRGAAIPVFEARSQPFGGTTPLKPVSDLLRAAYFEIAPGDSGETSIAAVARTLGAMGEAAPGDLALVCDLLGVPHGETVRSFMSATARRNHIIDIVVRLVQRPGQSPLVLLLEDLHWLDESSAAVVTALAAATAGTTTMLLVNSRPSSGEEWLDLPGCKRISLAEFDKAETTRLIDRLIGRQPNLALIRDRVADKSAGNPFFAEQLVRSLAEDGVLSGRPGAYARGRKPDRETLPATVQAVIADRLDHLSPSERETLHIAAVIGKEFEFPVLRDVAGNANGDLKGLVAGLCAGSLLCRVGSAQECRYAFRHPLIQDVAYTTQLKARRAVVHASVARALKRLSLSRREEVSGLIAFHLEEAGDGGEAAVFAARAARKIGQTDAVAAIKQWHKVRSLLADQPRSRDSDMLRIEANGQIGWLGWREGLSTADARPFLEEALAWARETDAAIIPLLMLIEGRINQIGGGDADGVVAWIQQAIAIADQNGDSGRIASLRAQLSQAYGWAGMLREALAANDAALAGAAEVSVFDQQLLGYSVSHWAEGLRGRIMLRLGRIEEATASFDQILALAGSIDPTVSLISHLGYVELGTHLHDGALASEHSSAIARIADAHGSGYLRLYQLLTQALASAASGMKTRAVAEVRAALAFMHQTAIGRELEPELLARLAEYLYADGDRDAASRTARQTIAMSLERNARLPQIRALITLACIEFEADETGMSDEAPARLAEARKLVETTGAYLYAPMFNAACDRVDPTMRLSAIGE